MKTASLVVKRRIPLHQIHRMAHLLCLPDQIPKNWKLSSIAQVRLNTALLFVTIMIVYRYERLLTSSDCWSTKVWRPASWLVRPSAGFGLWNFCWPHTERCIWGRVDSPFWGDWHNLGPPINDWPSNLTFTRLWLYHIHQQRWCSESGPRGTPRF